MAPGGCSLFAEIWDAVITIENQPFDPPGIVYPSMLSWRVHSPWRLFCGAKRTARYSIPGLIIICTLLDEVHVTKLATAPDRKLRGLAAHLIWKALAGASPESCCRAIPEFRSTNLGAIWIYHRRGFETIGERKRYYRPTGEDALVMA